MGHKEVCILLDGGSTLNFSQARMAKYLGIPILSATSFQVHVGNGYELSCSALCHQVPFCLQKYKFLVNFYPLPVSGADMVLGVQWLNLLGPILLGFDKLFLKSMWEGNMITLLGDSDKDMSTISTKQLHCLQGTGLIISYYHLSIQNFNTSTEST